MADFVQIIVVGIVGLSFPAIFNASGIVNFAQGEYTMLGAMPAFAFITSFRLPLLLALLVIIAIMVVIGLRFLLDLAQPLLSCKASLFTIVIGTLASSPVVGNTAPEHVDRLLLMPGDPSWAGPIHNTDGSPRRMRLPLSSGSAILARSRGHQPRRGGCLSLRP